MVQQYNYDLHRSVKMAKHKYRDKVERQFSCFGHEACVAGAPSDHGLQKESHITDIYAVLLDELKTFFSHFKHNND